MTRIIPERESLFVEFKSDLNRAVFAVQMKDGTSLLEWKTLLRAGSESSGGAFVNAFDAELAEHFGSVGAKPRGDSAERIVLQLDADAGADRQPPAQAGRPDGKGHAGHEAIGETKAKVA